MTKTITKLLLNGDTYQIKEYEFRSTWDITTADVGQISTGFGAGTTGPFVTDDGQYLFICNEQNNTLTRYTMSTPFDLNTAVQDQQISTNLSKPHQCFITPDGLNIFVANYVDGENGEVGHFHLSNPYDLTGATYSADMQYIQSLQGLCFNEDGTKCFWTQRTTCYCWDLASPYDVTTVLINRDVFYFGDEIRGIAYGNGNNTNHYFITRPGELEIYDMGINGNTYMRRDIYPDSGVCFMGNVTSDGKYLFVSLYNTIARIDFAG